MFGWLSTRGNGKIRPMTIATAIFVIAAGAILRYAITLDIEGIDIDVVGLILMICGAAGLAFSLLYELIWADRDKAAAAPPPDPYEDRTRRMR